MPDSPPESMQPLASDLLDIGDVQLAMSRATEAAQKLPANRITPSQADLLLQYLSQMRAAISKAAAYRGLP